MTNFVPLTDFEITKYYKNNYEYLEHLVIKGLNDRYGDNPSEEILKCVKYELKTINSLGFVNYFLTVWDIVQFAKSKNIPIGIGRGDAPCSIINYALGITNLDPIKFNLPFERFINPEKSSMPNISIDFCLLRRNEVTDYIIEKYINSAASIHTWGKFNPILANKNVYSFFEVKYENMQSPIRLDILGFSPLSIMHELENMIKKSDKNFDINNIPLDDSATFNMLSNGDTEGIFQFESDGMINILKNVKPDCIDDLNACVALFRPGPIKFGMLDDFILRKNGKQEIKYAHPILENILKNTYGLIIFQEQIMQILHELGGFSLGVAGVIRRELTKRKVEKVDKHIYQQYLKSATSKGLSEQAANELFDTLFEYSCICFNKSHSLSYAITSYQMAYLKCHYPNEFAKIIGKYKVKEEET